MNNLLLITSKATDQIKKIMSSAPEGVDSVVIGVDKSGCSGYSYKLDFGNSSDLKNLIENILEDKVKFIDQDHSKATYAKKIDKIEGQINWHNDAPSIIGQINGLFPAPGAFFNFKGERYKIIKGVIGNGSGKPGEVLTSNLEVACTNNQSIKIIEIQRQGKKPQNIQEFMLGSIIKKGSFISNV